MPQKSARNIQVFAINLYDYIWTKHSFTSQALMNHLTTKLCLQLEGNGQVRSVHFNETIGKAVLCSQYLLRQFCYDFFTCMGNSLIQSRCLFNFYVYFLLHKWIRYRNNVFTKVLDCCAIIAEAILFLEANTDILHEISLAPELFTEFFKCNLSAEFFEKGGWEQLTRKAEDDYTYLYFCLEELVDSVNPPYANFIYDQDLVDALRDSSVMFPVSYALMKENDFQLAVNEEKQHITYDRSLAEIFEQSSADATNADCLNKNSAIENSNEITEDFETDFVYVFIGGSDEDLLESCKSSTRKKKKRKTKNS